MARKDTAGVEIVNTVGELLQDMPCSGHRLMVDGKERREGNRKISPDIEKTTHDFRASLHIIIGFTELLLDEVPGKINEEQRRSLNDILDNSRRLLGLADDIVKRLETASADRK